MADNIKSGLDTAFKYVVSEKLADLVPNSSIIQRLVPMKEQDKVGRKFLFPVALTNELGFTFSSGGSIAAYNDSIAAVYDEAEIDPNNVILRSRVEQRAMNRLKAGDKKTFINQVSLRAGKMKESLMKIAEINILHGANGIGTVSAVSDSSGTNVLTISAATFAPGIWGGMEGLKLDAYTSTVKQNSNAALVVSAVDYVNKTITVTGNSSDTAAIDVGSILYLYGAYGVEQTGVIAQLDNAGSLFGINAASYSLWKAPELTVSGALTMAKILEGQAMAVNQGGLDEDVVLLVSPKTFESLNDDISAMRSFDSSYKSSLGELGVKSIKFHGQAGVIEIVAHPFMKEGEACSMPKSCLRRIGACDIEFVQDDGGGYWNKITGYNGYECVAQFEFQIFITQPAKCCLYKSIVNA